MFNLMLAMQGETNRFPRHPPWMDAMLNGVEHANIFESRATEYSRASTEGTWEEAFALRLTGKR